MKSSPAVYRRGCFYSAFSMNKNEIKKVVLAYSGGLDTSIIIPWLKENYNNCEVIAVSGNVGQADELEGLEEKALKTGASKLYVEDLTDEYVDDFIIPTMTDTKKIDAAFVANTYARFPLEIVAGKGSLVWDETGKEYIDLGSGIAVTSFGIADEGWQQAVCAQMAKVQHMVLGSGPIRIGQGIEFDYSSVHCVWSLREMGYEVVIVNNNPETVSTDYDTADRLYFEPLTAEDVGGILAVEQPVGVVVAFGGQTAIKLAKYLDEQGVHILGTSADGIDLAEDRARFDAMLEQFGIRRPKGLGVTTQEGALQAAHTLGYPVLLRPSYVIGGQNMAKVCGIKKTCLPGGWMSTFQTPAGARPPRRASCCGMQTLNLTFAIPRISSGRFTP